MTITVNKPVGSQALDPSDSPTYQIGTPPLPVPPFLDIPFVGTSLVKCPFAGFIAGPMQKSGTTLPVGPSMMNATSRLMSICKRSRLGVNAAVHRAMKIHLNWYKRPGPAHNFKGRNLLVPLPVITRPLLIQMMILQWEPPEVLEIRTEKSDTNLWGLI